VCEVCTVAAYVLDPAALALAEARAAAAAPHPPAGGSAFRPAAAAAQQRFAAQPPPAEPVVDWACCEGAVYNDKSFAKLACVMLTVFAALLVGGAVVGTGAVRSSGLKLG
jgi:hypothetical protein